MNRLNSKGIFMKRSRVLSKVLVVVLSLYFVFSSTIGVDAAPYYGVDASALASVPAYTGTAYAVINNNVPTFNPGDLTRLDAFETYSELDSLGRCGTAYANICKEIMPTQKRGEIGAVKPTGWHTVKYPTVISDLYLYNRCHLIGYQLAGENANTKNLITGTRYLNTTCMLPYENMVAQYVINTSHHVLYRVTPIYIGNNLVASGVIMEGYSVEDAGAGISFCIYCYNVQPGVIIDYTNGNSALDPNYVPTEEWQTQAIGVQNGQQVAGFATTFVLNTNTKKAHRQGCSSSLKMSEKNKQVVNSTPDSLQAQGYSPCKNCRPW